MRLFGFVTTGDGVLEASAVLSSVLEIVHDRIPVFSAVKERGQFGFCTVCRCDVSISHGGRADIKVHIASKKHQASLRAADNQASLTSFVRNDSDFGVIRAECLFGLNAFLVEHNIPLSVSDHAAPLFWKMFPRCDEAKRYACVRTKTTAIVREIAANAMAPLLDALKQRPFSIAVDGSNSRDSQLYPIVATYYVKEAARVESRLLCLGTIEGEATGQKIGHLILDEMKSRNLSIENLLAMSSDNANVMIGKKNGVTTVLRGAQPSLIRVGCPCYRINLAAHKAASCLPVKVDELLVDIFFLNSRKARNGKTN